MSFTIQRDASKLVVGGTPINISLWNTVPRYRSIPGNPPRKPSIVINNHSGAFIQFNLSGSNRIFCIQANGVTHPIELEDADSALTAEAYAATPTFPSGTGPNLIVIIVYQAIEVPVIVQNGVPFSSGQGSPNIFDVRTFGAAGVGSGDDGPSFQAAVNAATQNGGGAIYIPNGFVFNFKTGVIVNADNVQFIGDGFGSILQIDPGWNSTAPLIWYLQPSGAFRRGVIMRDFSIYGHNVAALVAAIELDGVRHADINHIEIHNCANINLYMNGANSPNYGAYNTIRACTFRDSFTGTGISLHNSEWCNIVDNQFVLFNQAGSIGIHLQGGLNTNIEGNLFDAIDTGVFLDFCNYSNVVGNQFDEINTSVIKTKAAVQNHIVSNSINSRTGLGAHVIDIDFFGANHGYNIIANNTATAGQGWTHFIFEHDSAGGANVGNYYASNDAGGYGFVLLTGLSKTVDNRTFNPQAFNTPTPVAGASGVGVTNNLGYDVIAYIDTTSAGGITGILIDGINVGIVNAVIEVGCYSTITLTYPGPGVPSWKWYGL